MRCASSISSRWKTDVLPLLGLMPDPLVLRAHAKWTRAMLMRVVRRAARR